MVTWPFKRSVSAASRFSWLRKNAPIVDFCPTLKRIPWRLGFILIAMFTIDIVFVLISIAEDARGFRDRFHVALDNGPAEKFQYVKWALLSTMLACRAIFSRSSMPGAWAVLFLYLLIDDSQQIHERFGELISLAWHFHPMLGLRAQDFGELIVTAIATVPLALLIGTIYIFSRERERIFCRTMLLLLIALAFFGVVVDMIDIIAPWRSLQLALGIIEDGGEMIVASLMVAYCVGTIMNENGSENRPDSPAES